VLTFSKMLHGRILKLVEGADDHFGVVMLVLGAGPRRGICILYVNVMEGGCYQGQFDSLQ
jgi:hypothetical protein